MTLTPGSALSRALALGLLASTLALVYLGAVRPILGAYQSSQARIEQLRDQGARFQRMAARRAELEGALAVAVRDPAHSRHYLQATSPALAVAELQAHLSRLIAAAKGRLQSTQALTAGEGEGEELRQVRLRVRLSADVEALRDLLYRLESATPLVVLDELSIRARPMRARRGSPAPQPQLEVQLEAVGFLPAGAS
jgi:general secretion pathway protein M